MIFQDKVGHDIEYRIEGLIMQDRNETDMNKKKYIEKQIHHLAEHYKNVTGQFYRREWR